jgi:WD40 repeat protein
MNSLSFVHNKPVIVSGNGDGMLKIWDATSRMEQAALIGHIQRVNNAAFSTDGTRVVTCSLDGTLKIWSTHSGDNQATLTAPDRAAVNSVAFSPDGTRIVSGASDKTVSIWDTASGKLRATLIGHTSGVTTVTFSPDGTKIVSAAEDGTLKIWEAVMSKKRATQAEDRSVVALRGNTSAVASTSFSPDGTQIVTNAVDGTLKIWDAASGTEKSTIKGDGGKIAKVTFSPDGRQIASVFVEGTVKFWDAANCVQLITPTANNEGAVISVSPDGKRTVGGRWDGTVIIWDDTTDKELASYKGRQIAVTSVAFSPDGTQIVAGFEDGTVKVWGGASFAERVTINGPSLKVTSASFSPDGKWIVSVYAKGLVRFWDAADGTELFEKYDASWPISASQLHPKKNKWLHVVDKLVYIVDLATSEAEQAFRKGRGIFRPYEANENYELSKDTYAKAFWKGQFALNLPNKSEHWDEFKSECLNEATWRLMRNNCDLVLKKGPNERAEEERAWANSQLETVDLRRQEPEE